MEGSRIHFAEVGGVGNEDKTLNFDNQPSVTGEGDVDSTPRFGGSDITVNGNNRDKKAKAIDDLTKRREEERVAQEEARKLYSVIEKIVKEHINANKKNNTNFEAAETIYTITRLNKELEFAMSLLASEVNEGKYILADKEVRNALIIFHDQKEKVSKAESNKYASAVEAEIDPRNRPDYWPTLRFYAEKAMTSDGAKWMVKLLQDGIMDYRLLNNLLTELYNNPKEFKDIKLSEEAVDILRQGLNDFLDTSPAAGLSESDKDAINADEVRRYIDSLPNGGSQDNTAIRKAA